MHVVHLACGMAVRRATKVSELCGITSTWQLHARVSNLCTYLLAQMHIQISPRADQFLFTTLDPPPDAPHQRLARFLQWWYVSKRTFPNEFCHKFTFTQSLSSLNFDRLDATSVGLEKSVLLLCHPNLSHTQHTHQRSRRNPTTSSKIPLLTASLRVSAPELFVFAPIECTLLFTFAPGNYFEAKMWAYLHCMCGSGLGSPVVAPIRCE